jgi:hypothetical protein
VLGIVLLVVGVGLLITGLNAKDSFADRWSDFWTGHFTDATMWYIVGGAATAVVGLVMTVSRGRTT